MDPDCFVLSWAAMSERTRFLFACPIHTSTSAPSQDRQDRQDSRQSPREPARERGSVCLKIFCYNEQTKCLSASSQPEGACPLSSLSVCPCVRSSVTNEPFERRFGKRLVLCRACLSVLDGFTPSTAAPDRPTWLVTLLTPEPRMCLPTRWNATGVAPLV